MEILMLKCVLCDNNNLATNLMSNTVHNINLCSCKISYFYLKLNFIGAEKRKLFYILVFRVCLVELEMTVNCNKFGLEALSRR